MAHGVRKETVTGYYDDEARRYDEQFYHRRDPYPPLRYRHNYMLAMVDAEGFPAGSTALDIGCGPGEMVRDLAGRGMRVWGIDIAPEMIAIARTKLGDVDESLVTLETGDIERLRFDDGMFDLVVCAGVVEYLDSDAQWARELYRVLKPGGVLVINVTNRYAIRRLTAPLLDRLKQSETIRRAMNLVKERILRRGAINWFPFRPRTHSPAGFDRFLREHGFETCGHRYFHFSILPYPLDTVLAPLTIPVRRWMERFSGRTMTLWGTGYIVKARKRQNP